MTPIHAYLDRIVHGDCLHVLPRLPAGSVDLVVTDPPYLVRYRSRDGRRVMGDTRGDWLQPAFAELYRVLRPHRFCVSFYGWTKIDLFMAAWRRAGFQPVGHFVWAKTYCSKRGFTRSHHENAYLLAKGNPRQPARAPSDVLTGRYTGNRLHPTQKPVEIMRTLIHAYSGIGDIVLDPFAGSGTTALAARQLERSFIAIEKDAGYHRLATQRLHHFP